MSLHFPAVSQINVPSCSMMCESTRRFGINSFSVPSSDLCCTPKPTSRSSVLKLQLQHEIRQYDRMINCITSIYHYIKTADITLTAIVLFSILFLHVHLSNVSRNITVTSLYSFITTVIITIVLYIITILITTP